MKRNVIEYTQETRRLHNSVYNILDPKQSSNKGLKEDAGTITQHSRWGLVLVKRSTYSIRTLSEMLSKPFVERVRSLLPPPPFLAINDLILMKLTNIAWTLLSRKDSPHLQHHQIHPVAVQQLQLLGNGRNCYHLNSSSIARMLHNDEFRRRLQIVLPIA